MDDTAPKSEVQQPEPVIDPQTAPVEEKLTIPVVPKPQEIEPQKILAPNQNIEEPGDIKRLTNPRKDRSGQEQTVYKYIAENGKEYELTEKERLFCDYYLETFGNRIDAVIEAGYEVWYKDKDGKVTDRINRQLCSVIASENLRKPQIINYINLRLDDYGFNDENVERQHLFLINQHDNLVAKSKGLDMFYKLKGKYAPEKVQHFFDEFDKMGNDELIAAAGITTPATTPISEPIPVAPPQPVNTPNPGSSTQDPSVSQ